MRLLTTVFASLVIATSSSSLVAFQDDRDTEGVGVGHADSVILDNQYSERLPQASSPITSTQAVDNWFQQNKKQLGFSESSAVSVEKLGEDINGYSNYRVKQTINGVAVFGHESAILVKDGQPDTGFVVSTNLQAPTPIDKANIAQILEIASKKHQLENVDADSATPIYWKNEKSLIAALLLSDVREKESEESSITLVIDSQGEKLFEYSNTHSTRFRTTDFDRACARQGIRSQIHPKDAEQLLRMTFNNSGNWSTSRSNTKTNNERKLYDLLNNGNRFMSQVLNTNSISNNPSFGFSAIVSTGWYGPLMNCGQPSNANAFWQAQNRLLAMHAPLLNNPEVILHELGHGVVSESAALIYQGQSGALNESFSDMLGVGFASWQAGRLNNPSRKLWQLRMGSMVIRDFVEPRSIYNRKIGQSLPDHYSVRYRGYEDKGGVHINSSITNHAFYLLVNGGTHRLGGRVDKIGFSKALRIWHYAVTRLLTRSSDFRDARYAVAKAAEVLYGEYGPERTAVHQSFDAVGIPGTWSIKVKPKEQPKKETVPPKEEPKETKQEEKKEEEKQKETQKKEDENKAPKKEIPNADGGNSVLIFVALGVLILIVFLLIKKFKPQRPETYNYNDRSRRQSRSATNNEPQLYNQVVSGNKPQSAPPAPAAQLIAQNQSYVIDPNKVSNQGVVIGRRSDCDIVLSHGSVSSYHARIKFENNNFTIEDMGSSYGTFVQGNQINARQKVTLNNATKLRLSDLDCEFKRGGGAPVQQQTNESHTRPPANQNSADNWTLKTEKGNYTLSAGLLSSKGISIGRSSSCDITIAHSSISSKHAVFSLSGGRLLITDCGSSYGTFVDGNKIAVGNHVAINPQTKLSLADLECRIESNKANGPAAANSARKQMWLIASGRTEIELDNYGEAYCRFSIGRSADNDITIDHPSISGKHGVVEFKNGGWYFTDLNSSYGSFVGQKVMPNIAVKIDHGQTLTLADLNFSIYTKI